MQHIVGAAGHRISIDEGLVMSKAAEIDSIFLLRPAVVKTGGSFSRP